MKFFRTLAVFTALMTLLAFSSDASEPVKVDAETAVNFNHVLDDYKPKKNHYNFFFTYKIVHPWWDAVAMGMEDAQRQLLEQGIVVDYDYLAPPAADAQDQSQRLYAAAQEDYDVIGVDVANEEIISPILDGLVEDGHKVMTFSTSDAAPGCQRIAFVGNPHNYEDGALLTEVLCKKLQYRGKVAILVGSRGAPCHEDRAKGAQDVIAKYPDMEVVAIEYDEDSIAKAQKLTEDILSKHNVLNGIICCNMSNPVGAARAVKASGRDIVIVGMDHDREALHDLKDGVIYCLGVQDCYSMGFDTIQVAVKIADGIAPGELYPETTEESTTIIYQSDAETMLKILFGEMG